MVKKNLLNFELNESKSISFLVYFNCESPEMVDLQGNDMTSLKSITEFNKSSRNDATLREKMHLA